MDSPPALGESIFTQADSMEGLCDELRDVVECHFGDNEGAMIKLIAIEPKQGYGMLLRFSNGACGTFDFTPFVEAGTEMTEPLRDPAFFKRCFIEAGALGIGLVVTLSLAFEQEMRPHDFGETRYYAPVPFMVVSALPLGTLASSQSES